MIVLNQDYNSKSLAEEIGVSYGSFRNERERYEQHLRLFYDFNIKRKGNGIVYCFTEQYLDFIPYREYQKEKKKKVYQNKIKAVIAEDARQTGSNIARIIYVEKEIQAFNCELSTVTNHTRANLKELVKQGYYSLEDYKWCFLDYGSNKYIEMTDKQIEKLRSYFKDEEGKEEIENAMVQRSEGYIGKDEANEIVGEQKYKGFLKGLERFIEEFGFRPIKVPMYARNGILIE